MKNLVIVFYNAGFAGDLISALINPNVFLKFSNGRVILKDDVWLLKDINNRTKWTIQQKKDYIKKITQTYNVCSSHDIEMALLYKNNTLLPYCSDVNLLKKFHKRFKKYAPQQKTTFEEMLDQQNINCKIFKNKVDLKKIFVGDILSELKLKKTHKRINLLKTWKKINSDIVI